MFSFFKKSAKDGGSNAIQKDATIIDVRSESEFLSGHISGAINIPLEQIEAKANTIKTFSQVILYCRSGNRSAHAKKLLQGFAISNIIDAGGLSDAKELLQLPIDAEVSSKTTVATAMAAIKSTKDEDVLKVLIPTDFSVQGDFAYLMVKKLEENLTLDVHFLHVIDVPSTVSLDEAGQLVTCGEIDPGYIKNQMETVKQKLSALKSQTKENCSVHLQLGKVSDTIVNFAESNHFDLIVMGTKGLWGLKEKITSSQTQIIARKSSVPLLSLMCDRSDSSINDILFVHDFNHDENVSVPLMSKFSTFFNATFHQLYITSESTVLNKEVIEARMANYALSHGVNNYINHFITAGSVEEGVKSFVNTQNIDLLFVSTHGKGSFFHISEAESLIKHLFKPVITFHINQN